MYGPCNEPLKLASRYSPGENPYFWCAKLNLQSFHNDMMWHFPVKYEVNLGTDFSQEMCSVFSCLWFSEKESSVFWNYFGHSKS